MGHSRIILKIYSVIATDYIFFMPIVFAVCCLIFNIVNVVTFFIALIPFYWKKINIIAVTFRRDVVYISRLWRLVLVSKQCEKDNMTVWKIFQKHVASNPQKSCFLFKDQVWTYQDVDDYCNRVANVFHEAGYKAGDTVALMMNNRPEYVCVWLGLSKLGVITALINPKLKGSPLNHCIKISESKAIIYHEEFTSVLEEACDLILQKYKFIENSKLLDMSENTNGLKIFNQILSNASTQVDLCEHRVNYQDKLLYIYTSGTTGMPKAAIMSNCRYILGGMAPKYSCDLKEDDVIYNCLPLCHTSGGCLAVGLSIISGITTIIKPKFSASSYFADCSKYNATGAMYIGEMCRYILAANKEGTDVSHNLRLMIGNGLRPAIWSKFVDRFKIPHIFEFYGATEGNVNMANIDNKVGAVGWIPNLIPRSINPIALIKVDLETGQPTRNTFGLCVRCSPGEPGMLVGVIDANDATRNYPGYVNKTESEKKVIKNVLSIGDSAFASGDILEMDEYGYLYFKDRTGDTFRWKGENVSTCEVESVISCITGLSDCIVYGVQVGDYEGRAGMTAIVQNEDNFDLTSFATKLDANLAGYARPVFLRFLPSVSLTATFKLCKADVEKLGIDPSLSPSSHRLLFRHLNTFVPLTKDIYKDILSGTIRL